MQSGFHMNITLDNELSYAYAEPFMFYERRRRRQEPIQIDTPIKRIMFGGARLITTPHIKPLTKRQKRRNRAKRQIKK